ncbi:hypothetical protein [Mesotoga sp.]|uniref:hypothetical protein n=1 Tax=Mesotoga sp. TaxID=2053577 RepID=UPI00345E8FE7
MDTRQFLRKEIEAVPDALLEEILRFVKALKKRKESTCLKSRAAGCFRVGSCQGLAEGRRGYSMERLVNVDVVNSFPFL